MLRRTGSASGESLQRTQIREMVNISMMAIRSTLMANHPYTPDFIKHAMILSFKSL